MNLGAVLRKARLHAGLSQEEMAEELYLPRSTISKLENNKVILKAEDLIKWCNVTQAQEVAVALIFGIDIPTVVQNLTTLIGGFIFWI
ncbi:helix-turn-helix domain-containing protein [Lederbergia sp. NSJ-179]|uniref:helix-turn-helix domain-containing protein n=1 Tax=Lederbergia sp. NSJ-179 TaxID=2931402 RepID=UPI001FD622F5|nr:helix-turn-helix transcriptional regulator [Lederbergia sp. NSJ-179]MCJ7840537.1 helix-turn-helix domain-containing protein [Lederbergia sp. NSJ-179]